MVQIVLPISITDPDAAGGDGDGGGHILLELQGSLSTDGNAALEGLHLGKFSQCPTTGAATLAIGHHKLEGRRVELRKPFAVVRKRRQRQGGSSDTYPAPTPAQPQSLSQPARHEEGNGDNVTDDHHEHPPPVRLELSMSLSQGLAEVMDLSLGDDGVGSASEMGMDDADPDASDGTKPAVGKHDHDKATQPSADAQAPQHLYDVVAVLRFKYLFKSRPEHILAEEHKGLVALPRR
ncbi:hypothetical protein HDU86_002947 [Geranomyces michiganensis]|nr:hypothetical protein HDU86_002947 [Geranomyces michiganensis]